MILRSTALMCAIILATVGLACSGGSSSPVSGDMTANAVRENAGGSVLWGMYDVTIDPSTGQVEIVPIRGVEFTANVTMFMQPPISKTHLLGLKIDSGLSDLANGLVVCDVTLRHPFPGLAMYRGFDVHGIVMGDGSLNLNHDSAALYAGPNDLTLKNPDGHTRWFNPSEFFPHGTIFGYQQGGLAPKGYLPTATLNAYKYFADELGATDPFVLDPAKRGTFSPTSVNTRRYELQFPMVGGVPFYRFAYAIEANWDTPDPSGAPYFPLEAFSTCANAPEACMVKLTDAGSTAWYINNTLKGGSLKLDIEVFDWQAPSNPLGVKGELSGLWMESELLSAPVDLLPIATVLPGGAISSVFEVEIANPILMHSGPTEVWIIAESSDPATYEPTFGGDTSPFSWPDAPLAAYLRGSINITGIEPPPTVSGIDPINGEQNTTVAATVTGSLFLNGAQVELRQSGVPTPHVVPATGETWVNAGKILCSLDLTGAPLGMYDVAVINPSGMQGVLASAFEVQQQHVIYVDDSNTSGTEDGTKAYPYNTIQEGLAAAPVGWQVWVDDSGGTYAGAVTLKSGVILKSVNWDPGDGTDEATISYGGGGGAVIGADNATIQGFKIDGNQVGLECSGTSPEILDCRVVNLVGPQWGSAIGIYLHGGALPHLDNVEVYDITNGGGNWESLYGIIIDTCPAVGPNKVLIEHTYVHYMYTSGLIGGSYCSPYGIYINASDGVEIRNTIVNNISSGNYNDAFGVYINASANVKFVNDVIYEVDKYYYYGNAYGLYLGNCTNFDARNLIVSHMHGGEGGTGGYYQAAYGVTQGGSTYTFEYSDVFDCSSGYYNGVAPGVGCKNLNPLYVAAGSDFHLAPGSPCINAGDPAIHDPDNSQSDMGAYGGPGGDW